MVRAAPFLRLLLCAVFLSGSLAAHAFNVVFLNPGKSDEKFWVSVSRFMQASADELGIKLEILYAERDAARLVTNAREVLRRPAKPDYLVVVNEKQVATEILRLTSGSGIKVFMLLNSLSDEQRLALQAEGTPLGHWIGSLVPDNENAGYSMAKALFSEARKRKPGLAGTYPMIAISGDKSTPASIERDLGLRRALAEHPEVKLQQLVYGEWNQQRAREQTEILLARYPDTRIVWAANDLMAFGAMQAAEGKGVTPGQGILFSGLNNSREAMEARASGRLSVLVAGHFTAGGWAMVMLHDYHAGKGPSTPAAKHRRDPLFAVLGEAESRRFLEVFGEARFAHIDFRRFSLALNPRLREYSFSLLPLLK